MFNIKTKIAKPTFFGICLVLLLLLSAFTQLYKLTEVPGFHFDEAWQGLYAHRIATENGFWPLTAMNSYTSPVVHYILAAVFKLTSPTLFAMRLTYAFMNLATLVALALLLWRRATPLASLWFMLFWALLPLSVHNHRFYIEMTGFHGFCLAALLWGCALWNQRPKLSSILVVSSLILGSYSHILFISVFLTLVFMWPRLKDDFPVRTARSAALTAFAISPLAINMGLSLQKKLPLILGTFFLLGGLVLFYLSLKPRANVGLAQIHKRLENLHKMIMKVFYVAALPFSLFYIAFLWDGFWTYAQVTGDITRFWLPLNSMIFLLILFIFMKKIRDENTTLAWQSFIVLFVFSSAMILKQAPRYYMTATILGIIWCSLVLEKFPRGLKSFCLVAVFLSWNSYSFLARYIYPFEKAGGVDGEFSLWRFKDSNRDFRPFQKAFAWAEDQGCGHVIRWVEDDRFLRSVQFLQLTTPPSLKQCPWERDNILFSHWPPAEIGHVKLVAQRPEWGDLTFSERVIKTQTSTNQPPVVGK